jgi:uncharacterized RDD family membrane protein YckC
MAASDNLVISSITGTSVELPIAGPGGRSYAFIIDWHIRALAAIILLIIAIVLVSGEIETGSATFFLVAVPPSVVYFLYHPILEVLMHGSTPGKRIAGVRIVDRDGGVPSAGALLIRNVFRLVDSLPTLYLVGLVTTMVTAQSVRLGDLAAGTVLVYENRHKADVFDDIQKHQGHGLNPQLVELTVDLLERWSQLSDATRLAIGAQILSGAQVENDGKGYDARAMHKKLQQLIA